MARQILLVDWLVFLGLPLLLSGLVVWAVLTPQLWEPQGVIMVVAVMTLVWSICIIALWGKVSGDPDYELTSHVRVWTNGILIPRPKVEAVIQKFVTRLPQLIEVDQEAIEAMLSLTAIEFVRAPIFLGNRFVAGYQTGFYIRVQWLDGFQKNALVHELIHMVQEVVMQQEPDYEHQAREWWQAAATIQSEIG